MGRFPTERTRFLRSRVALQSIMFAVLVASRHVPSHLDPVSEANFGFPGWALSTAFD